MSDYKSTLICPKCGNNIAMSELTIYMNKDQNLKCNKCSYEFKRGAENLETTVLDYLRNGRYIYAVTYYRYATSSDLKPSKEYVDKLAERYGIKT